MRAPGVRVGPRVSIFTRPAVVWALCGPLPLWTSGAVSGGRLERAVCRLDGKSPLAYVRKIASTPSTLSRYGGRGAIWESLLRLGLRRLWYG